MVGANAARLDLGSSNSRLHPVFNVSLLTPFVDLVVAGRLPTGVPSLLGTSPLPPLQDWRHAAGILDFRVCGQQLPEYLLRWVNGTPYDDTWVPLHDISVYLNFLFNGFSSEIPFSLCSKAFVTVS